MKTNEMLMPGESRKSICLVNKAERRPNKMPMIEETKKTRQKRSTAKATNSRLVFSAKLAVRSSKAVVVSTIATASFVTLSPNTNMCKSGSTFNDCKQVKTIQT